MIGTERNWANSGSTAIHKRQYRPSGSTAPMGVVVPLKTGKRRFPNVVVKSSTIGLPNSKILLPIINPTSLVAFVNLLKPRFSQKSRDATTISPKTLDLKSRQKERRNGGNTGIHGKRTGWGSTPPKEMERDGPDMAAHRSPPTSSTTLKHERGRGRLANGCGGERNSPCPT